MWNKKENFLIWRISGESSIFWSIISSNVAVPIEDDDVNEENKYCALRSSLRKYSSE
jgi:hypothetical protein